MDPSGVNVVVCFTTEVLSRMRIALRRLDEPRIADGPPVADSKV